MVKHAAWVIAVLIVVAGPEGRAAEPQSLNELSLEVSALEVLYQLQATRPQLQALKKVAAGTLDEKPAARQPAKGGESLRKVLSELRDVLARARDHDRILGLMERLEKVYEKEMPELDDVVEITDEAREAVPKVLKLFTARQVGLLVGALADDVPEPLDVLCDALEEARGLDDEEWKEYRASVGDEIGRLLGGLDAEKAGALGDRAVQLLIVARGLSAAVFKDERAELEAKARALVGDVGPTEVLRHAVEYRLAELLSNPRLKEALEARLEYEKEAVKD